LCTGSWTSPVHGLNWRLLSRQQNVLPRARELFAWSGQFEVGYVAGVDRSRDSAQDSNAYGQPGHDDVVVTQFVADSSARAGSLGERRPVLGWLINEHERAA
jgi:hypothetical protein